MDEKTVFRKYQRDKNLFKFAPQAHTHLVLLITWHKTLYYNYSNQVALISLDEMKVFLFDHRVEKKLPKEISKRKQKLVFSETFEFRVLFCVFRFFFGENLKLMNSLGFLMVEWHGMLDKRRILKPSVKVNSSHGFGERFLKIKLGDGETLKPKDCSSVTQQ